jgi:hypothetical protein
LPLGANFEHLSGRNSIHLVLVFYIFCESDKNISSFACKSWSKCFNLSCLGWWLSCTLRVSRSLHISNFLSSLLENIEYMELHHIRQVLHLVVIPVLKVFVLLVNIRSNWHVDGFAGQVILLQSGTSSVSLKISQ